MEGVVENFQTGTTQKFPAGMGLTHWRASPDTSPTLQFLHSALSDWKHQSADLIFFQEILGKLNKQNFQKIILLRKVMLFRLKKKKKHFESVESVFFFISVAIEIKIM